MHLTVNDSTMFRQYFIPFSFLILILLVSCKKEADKSTTNNKKFNISVGSNYIDSITQKWVFITDKNGISSEAYQLVNNSSVSIDVPGSYVEGDKFMLNVFSYSTYFNNVEVKSFNMESNTELPPGDYKLKIDSVFSYPPERSTHFMKMANVPIVFGNLNPGSFGKNVTGNESSYYPGNLWDIKTSFADDTTDITYYGLFNNEWKYLTINGATNNQTTEVAYSAMNPMENHVQFQFDNAYTARCKTYGVNNKDYLRKISLNSSAYMNLNPVSSLTYYYPNSSFNEYITEVSLNTNTIYQTEYTLGNAVANSFIGWSGRVLSATVQNGNLITELSQDADILSCASSTFYLSNGKQFNLGWRITTSGEKNRNIKLPILPSQLTAVYPDWVAYTPRFNYVTAVKTNVTDAYNDYISNKFIKDVSPIVPFFFYPKHQRVVVHTQMLAN